MNDATEFESSLAGAIDFFQNLRRKLGALETDSGGQHDRLQAVAATVATLEQDQRQFRQSLATLASDLRSHGDHLRQELNVLEQRIAPGARINALEEQFERHLARLGELQQQQERLKHLDILIGKVSADTNSTRQILNVLQTDLTTQSDTLRELDQSWHESLAAYQDRLSQLENTAAGSGSLARIPEVPADYPVVPAPIAEFELATLRETLATQVQELVELRQAMEQQLTALTARLDSQRQEFSDISDWIGSLRQDIEQLRLERSTPVPAAGQPSPAETSSPETRQLRQDFDSLQEMVTALATRLIGQAQNFGDSLDQVRSLNAEIRNLQQQAAKLESLPRQLSTLEQGLAVQQQETVLLNDAVRQLQTDSQQFNETLRQGGHDPRVAELEIRLNEQSEQLAGLNATVETIRTDARTTQEKVLTLATNVAKRIHEFQNQMSATETAQGERLQEIEQKLIWLQATLETLEARRKSRRWFNMPATFSTIVLAVGSALLAILAQVIRTIG